MKKEWMLVLALSVAAASAPIHAQTTTTKAQKKAKTKPGSEVAEQLREMREAEAKMQAQINELKSQLADRDAKLSGAAQIVQDAQTQAAQANAKAAEVSTSIQEEDDRVKDLQGQINTLGVTDTAAIKAVDDSQKKLAADVHEPASIHYKGVTFTPVGFLAAESVYRSRSMNSDVNTPFSATPYKNSPQAYLSEFNASGRQSRLGLQVTAPTPWGRMGGYYEMDFLSAGVTSNDNQTNSYTMRQRQLWGQFAVNNGFTFTGGQMWSLVTETKKGLNSAPGIENLPNTIDAQYHVGFSFTRQYGIRLAQQLGRYNQVALGIEESQTVLAGSTNLPYNFFFGGQGSTGGLYSSTGGGSADAPGAQNYSNNVAPDFIVKWANDSPYGHYELGGIVRLFRDRYYPTLGYQPTAPASVPQGAGVNNTVAGGGFFANARFPVTKYLDIGLHVMQGTGVGRYGTSNLGDVTVKPNGTFEPLRSSQGLLSIETHPTKKLDIYGYAGGEYLQRTYYTTTLTAASGVATTYYVGYAPLLSKSVFTPASGSTPASTVLTYGQVDTGCGTEPTVTTNNGITNATGGSCSGSTRDVLEGTVGFTYRVYSSPKLGRIQYQATYSYLTKGAWTGQNTNNPSGFGSPKATNNMIFTGFRYYIP
ncbi:FoF1-type ATP synthase, membrane subunit b or b' [Granulicella pectinivorans]|jgi:TolA-binding protein|uniref:FoF1-type ATP synthase, membrane subunit b or b n=1 Tax=Granulicella pectinivorans TaxID=474950 RepID=A0A1I6L970_9BACT|nr:hypothetical protein [Granulicella pectinivorans]SFR99992.1 FoF1-type ATP synthase, membrane subunit b or b' [Granulicella pectinivorans]